jgi:hypothetical protein
MDGRMKINDAWYFMTSAEPVYLLMDATDLLHSRQKAQNRPIAAQAVGTKVEVSSQLCRRRAQYVLAFPLSSLVQNLLR